MSKELVEVEPPIYSSHLFQEEEVGEEDEIEEEFPVDGEQKSEVDSEDDKKIQLEQNDFEETLTGATPTEFSSNKGRKYANEEPQHENWPRHKKHIFILSSAGKPVYSRYGDESSLAGFFGVIQAIISFVADDGDHIRYVTAGPLKIVFVLKGPIYLVSVSKTGEPVSQLSQQLNYMYSQIISILTGRIVSILEKRAQFDIRNLLGGFFFFSFFFIMWNY